MIRSIVLIFVTLIATHSGFADQLIQEQIVYQPDTAKSSIVKTTITNSKTGKKEIFFERCKTDGVCTYLNKKPLTNPVIEQLFKNISNVKYGKKFIESTLTADQLASILKSLFKTIE